MNRTSILGLVICAMVLLIACEQQRDPCLEPKTVSMRVVAKQAVNDSTSVDTLLASPVWIAIDSQFAIKFPDRSAHFGLLLSPLADSCRWAIQPDSAVLAFDTLTFHYNRKLLFLSNACGFTYHFSLREVRSTRHQVDSVRLNNTDVNENATAPEHVQIFF